MAPGGEAPVTSIHLWQSPSAGSLLHITKTQADFVDERRGRPSQSCLPLVLMPPGLAGKVLEVDVEALFFCVQLRLLGPASAVDWCTHISDSMVIGIVTEGLYAEKPLIGPAAFGALDLKVPRCLHRVY